MTRAPSAIPDDQPPDPRRGSGEDIDTRPRA